MQDIKERIKVLAGEFDLFLKSFNLDKKKDDLMVLEGKTTDPDLWKDPDAAKRILQAYSDLKKEIEKVGDLKDEIAIIKELIEGGETSSDIEKAISKAEETLDKLNLETFLSGHYDAKNATVSIHAGQGGTEAMDWASMLLRMYLRFCERRGWKTSIIDQTPGEEAGIKSITFLVSGSYAYGYLKGEAGTHRLVRQSPFNADNLRQTSFALVEILPELSEIDLPDIAIKPEDIEISFFHSSSQGGQNVQKVSTAVRIIHKKTGIVVTAQSERFQEQNRKIAMNLLRAKLWALEEKKAAETKKGLKGDYKPASWGNQIRSYVLHPYKMVKDLRTEVETGNPDAVLDGELDEFIEAELRLITNG
jgi:peptide chain release factor 2